jgi:cyanamide hydratase family protein with HD domain
MIGRHVALPLHATLSRTEKFAFARQTVAAQLRGLPGMVRTYLGLSASSSAMHLQADPPDSVLARQALQRAEEVYGVELFNHCLRCWYFGDLFAQVERQRYDPELLYIACLLHDVALTAENRPTSHDVPCFAIHGGQLADQALLSWGANNDTAQSVSDAIAAHMNVSVPVEQGVEAHLLHAAAHLDVTGARAWNIPRPLIQRVIAQYPREDFAPRLIEVLRREAHEHPDSRTAVLWRLGARAAIALNPINSLGTSGDQNG